MREEKKAAPAAVTVPSDPEIDDLVANIGPTEGIRRDSRDLTMDKLRVLVRRALATWGHVNAAPAPQQEAQEPVAYAIFAENGNIRLWATEPQHVKRIAAEQGLSLVKLYAAPQPAPVAQGDARAEEALLKVLSAVQRYLPPDGPSAKDTLTEIIGIVDPWPLDGPKGNV